MNTNSNYSWFEVLPEQCPPKDANPCDGCYYRIVKSLPTPSEDYFSQRAMNPDKVFSGEGIDECIARSVSLFNSVDEAKKRLKLPRFKNQTIVSVALEPKDGIMKKSFGPAHYSWWRSTEFDITKAKLAL